MMNKNKLWFWWLTIHTSICWIGLIFFVLVGEFSWAFFSGIASIISMQILSTEVILEKLNND